MGGIGGKKGLDILIASARLVFIHWEMLGTLLATADQKK